MISTILAKWSMLRLLPCNKKKVKKFTARCRRKIISNYTTEENADQLMVERINSFSIGQSFRRAFNSPEWVFPKCWTSERVRIYIFCRGRGPLVAKSHESLRSKYPVTVCALVIQGLGINDTFNSTVELINTNKERWALALTNDVFTASSPGSFESEPKHVECACMPVH